MKQPIKKALFGLVGTLLWIAVPASHEAESKVIDEVLAAVDQEIICIEDLRFFREIESYIAGGSSEQALHTLLERYIDRLLLLQEIQRIGVIKVYREEIRKTLVKLAEGRSISPALFIVEAESKGLSLSQIQNWIKQNLLIEKFISMRIKSFIQITEKEIQQTFDRQKRKANRPDLVLNPEMKKMIRRLVIERKTTAQLGELLEKLKSKTPIDILKEDITEPEKATDIEKDSGAPGISFPTGRD